MPPDYLAPIVALTILTLVTGLVLVLRGPVGRAIGRRIEGVATEPPELEHRLQDLEARVHAGEAERAELLERVEFAERMLLTARDQPKELRQ